MKKLTFKSLLTVVLLIVVGIGTAYAQVYSKGDKLLNIGVGLGGGFGPSGSKGIPPVGLSLEFGTTDKISLGGYAGYSSAEQDIWGNIKASYTYIVVGARGSYHFDLNVEKLDTYVGAMLGYNIASSKVTGGAWPAGFDNSAGGIAYSGHVGGRYYLGEKLGVFGELGYGVSYLTIGVAFKL